MITTNHHDDSRQRLAHRARLEELQAGRLSGALLIELNGRTASLCLADGAIVHVLFMGRIGAQALALIRDAYALYGDSARLSFRPGPVSVCDSGLPPSGVIIGQLFSAPPPSSDPTQTPPRVVASGGGGMALDDLNRAVLETACFELIGPAAETLCADALRGVETLRDAVDMIAAALPSRRLERKLVDRVRCGVSVLGAGAAAPGAIPEPATPGGAVRQTGMALLLQGFLLDSLIDSGLGAADVAACRDAVARAEPLSALINHVIRSLPDRDQAARVKQAYLRNQLALGKRRHDDDSDAAA